MEISSNSFNYSVQGIQKSQQMLNKSAQKVADGSGDLAEETVQQIIAEKSQSANVTAIQTADEMLAELMNMKR